jgi:hypothetical protein
MKLYSALFIFVTTFLSCNNLENSNTTNNQSVEATIEYLHLIGIENVNNFIKSDGKEVQINGLNLYYLYFECDAYSSNEVEFNNEAYEIDNNNVYHLKGIMKLEKYDSGYKPFIPETLDIDMRMAIELTETSQNY